LRTGEVRAAFLCLFLAGCASPLAKVATVEQVVVTWERRTPFFCGDVLGAAGCAYRDHGYRHCTIVAPEDVSDAVLGHELRHCFGWEHQ
jgi:hypothetical protein